MTQTTPLDPSELEGKTRADLLELCRARGLKATAWKRDRMFAALTGTEEPAPVKKNVLAEQLEERRELDGAELKARENMLKRTGACGSASGCKCEAYEFGWKDAFHWELCSCGHTQWAHSLPADTAE